MSVTYGFYNSLNDDRTYDSVQLSSIFDGLIIDGVFSSIGTCFVVKADSGLNVNVGTGKAWFHHTWTLNDSILPLRAPLSEVLLNRIDAIILEVNSSEEIRANSIKFIRGIPASAPNNPVLTSNKYVHQYPLCYIYRAAGNDTITQSNITNTIGTPVTPFVTGIMSTISLDKLLGKWENELDLFIEHQTTDFNVWNSNKKYEFTDWFDKMKIDFHAIRALFVQWISEEKTDFQTWFATIQNILTQDIAGELALRILALECTIDGGDWDNPIPDSLPQSMQGYLLYAHNQDPTAHRNLEIVAERK